MVEIAGFARGTVFAADYRIVEPLAQGGMGAVYVVDQISTGKQRALKLMHPQLVADAVMRRRFEQEARIGARIESEHVVAVNVAGVDAATGVPYLVMELLRGSDLAAHVVARGWLPPADVRGIFEQLCHAVASAHAAGIVHRDLKPENVFLATSRRAGSTHTVKVLDFGIAKLVEEAGSRSTAALGSPLWMAPEQTERAPVTPATDVWALGLIAFRLITGAFYWRSAQADNTTIAQLLREIVLDPIPSASVRAGELGRAHLIPPGFDEWFARCVARPPQDRFPNAREAWSALDAVLGPQSASLSVVHAPTEFALTPPSAPAAANVMPWAAGAFVLVTLLGAGGWAALRHTTPTPLKAVAPSADVVQSIPASIIVSDDLGAPISGATLSRRGELLGTTGTNGRFFADIAGKDGDVIEIVVGCPSGYIAPSKPVMVTLKRFTGGDPNAPTAPWGREDAVIGNDTKARCSSPADGGDASPD